MARTAQKLIEEHEPDAAVAKKGLISLCGFLRFLLSSDSAVLSEETYDLRPEDMGEPLSHYFINSSHNTYLIGHQAHSPPPTAFPWIVQGVSQLLIHTLMYA